MVGLECNRVVIVRLIHDRWTTSSEKLKLVLCVTVMERTSWVRRATGKIVGGESAAEGWHICHGDIHTLILDLSRNEIGDALDLSRNEIGYAGAQALAMLKDSTTLHTLTLNLGGNEIGDAGAQALAMLKDSRTLRTLSLTLDFNEIGDAGAQALAMLKDSTTLRTLSLTLDFNEIGYAGAQALAMLKDSTTLRVLTLNVHPRFWRTLQCRHLQLDR